MGMRMGDAETLGRRRVHAVLPGVQLMGIDRASSPHRGVKEHFSVASMLAGHVETWRRGRVQTYVAGAVIASRAGDVHSDRRIVSPATYRIAAFDEELVVQAREALGVPPRGEVELDEIDARSPEAERVRQMHRTLFAANVELAEQEEAARDGLRALLGLASQHRRTREPHEAPAFVRRAQDFIRERHDAGLRIQDAADAAGIDQFRLIRAFRQHVGMSPYEWFTQLRIQRAKTLLAAGHSATEVAQQLGYCDQSQLHRHFRRIVGMTPGAYAREVSLPRFSLFARRHRRPRLRS
jgi:AraC-like DNA-binding protein